MISSQVMFSNINNVRQQISRKKGSNPYYATLNLGDEVITDYDIWPYTRWYRGIPEASFPIVADREAGWRNPAKGQYIKPSNAHSKKPAHCFQAACSVVYPCSLKLLEQDVESGSASSSAYDDTIDILVQKNGVNANH